jgi:hypothetical protein
MDRTSGQRASDGELLHLRRTITPYVGQTSIFAAVTLLEFSVAYMRHAWDLLWIVAVMWVLYGLYVLFFGLRYGIFWDSTGVIMRASGGPPRRIGFDEIAEVRYETAGASEYLSQARPFRRLVIRGRRNPAEASIDVSLRHFRPDDIKALLAMIHERRPELTVPAIPLH